MTYDQLAKHLNDTGHRASYGTKYTGNRGVARLTSSVFNNLLKLGDKKSTERISQAFTNNHGKHPWD